MAANKSKPGAGQRTKSRQHTKRNAVKSRSTTSGTHTTRRSSAGVTVMKKSRNAVSSTSQSRHVKEHNAANHSSYGALKHLGPAPSAEDIAEVRREVWSTFSSDEAA